MPSWNIHTAHVERLLREEGAAALGVVDVNAFLFGNFVPDGVNGIQRDPAESDEEFQTRVLDDIRKSHDLIVQEVGQVTFFAYPFGVTEPDAEELVNELFPVTVVTKAGTADLRDGLRQMPRYTVTMNKPLGTILG